MQKKLEIIISVIIAIFPALAIYIFLPGTSLASVLLWLCFIPLFFLEKNKEFNYDEICFLFCIILISILSALIHMMVGAEWFDFVLFYHNMYSIAICLIPLCFVTNFINVQFFVKTVLVFGFIASSILIWQWFSFFFTGSFEKDFFMPWFEINRDLDTLSKYRPSSFFTEPAHFAIYILPAFQIALIYKKKIFIYLFAISILFSGSSTGFILLAVLLVYHLYHVGTKKWYIALLGFILLLASIYIIYVLFPEVFMNNFDKLESVESGKSDSRLLGPLKYLSLFFSYDHLWGISLNQLDNFLNMVGSFGSTKNYANASIYMYISFGVTGFVSFLIYIVKKWLRINTSYGFLLIFLGIICSDQILFNGNYFYLVIFVLLTDKICKNEKMDYEELCS